MKRSLLLMIIAASLLAGVTTRADTFAITYGNPGVQTPSSTVQANATVLGIETFDARPENSNGFTTNFGTGGAITGTYSMGAAIAPASIFGGAGGTGRFVQVVGGTSGYTVTLSTSAGVAGVNYFGFWLSALDAGNQLEFLRNGTVVGTFMPTDLIAALGPCVPLGSNPFCGNPNPIFAGRALGEQFAFVNFVDTSGFFNQLHFTENPNVGNYESDNHTVAFCANPGACISGTPVGPIPEPASFTLISTALASLGFLARCRKKAP